MKEYLIWISSCWITSEQQVTMSKDKEAGRDFHLQSAPLRQRRDCLGSIGPAGLGMFCGQGSAVGTALDPVYGQLGRKVMGLCSLHPQQRCLLPWAPFPPQQLPAQGREGREMTH